MGEVKAAGGSRGLELAVGEYELTIKEVKGVQTRNKGPAIDFVFEVTASSGEGATPVGTTSNEFCIESNDIGCLYLKTMLVVLLGLDPSNAADAKLIKDEDWNKARDTVYLEKSWALGRKIRCSVKEAKYKNKRDDGKTHYLRRDYAPHPSVREAMQEKLAKAAAKK